MKFKDLVGHRIILDRGSPYSSCKEYVEVIIVELSPSGKRVKLKFPSGHEEWEEIHENGYRYEKLGEDQIIEDLGKGKKGKKGKIK